MDAGSKPAMQRRMSQNSVSHRGLPKTDGGPHNCTVGMIAGFGRSWSEQVTCQLRGSVFSPALDDDLHDANNWCVF